MPSYVVTGAARGIGLEFVRQLSASPSNTVFALIRSKATAKWLEELIVERKNVHILEADISDVEKLKTAATEVAKITGGKLDVLISNAAILTEGNQRHLYTLSSYPEEEYSKLEEDLLYVFKVNAIGVVHTINAFLPLLHAGDSKKVIALSSGLGDADLTISAGFSDKAPYSISKAALNMAIAKYAAESRDKKDGFIYLSISPGIVNTSATRTMAPSPEEMKNAQTMMDKVMQVKPEFKGPITPEMSVKLMLGVIDNLKPEDSGTSISQNGNKDWL